MSVENLPHTSLEPRHRWGDPARLIDRTERTCAHCGLVKITVHPPHGYPWREWRHRDSPVRIALTTTPPCLQERR